MSKVVIIGCGVVGASIAYELSLIPGLDLTVIERNLPAAGATSAALGVLMGIISHKTKGRAWRLRETSIQRYQTLIPELESKTGLKIPVNRQGILKLLFEEDNWEKWQKLQKIRQAQGWELELGDRSYLKQRCPQILGDNLLGAVYSPQDGQIHPVKLTEALVAAAQANGVKFQFQTTVADFTVKDSLEKSEDLKVCQELTTSKGKIPVEQLIITAGLGSTLLTQTLKQTIPIRPVLGQAIALQLDHCLGDPNFQPAITGNDIHIVPLGNNQYWLGATVEFPETTAGDIANAELLEQLWQRAIAFCPELKNAQILRSWCGKRPRPEGIPAPIIGNLSGYKNVILATAHYRNGVLLAPGTALAVADMVKQGLATVSKLSSG